MKTLNDFKDEVAKEDGFISWESLLAISKTFYIDVKYSQVANRYAEYMAVRFQYWIMEGNGFIEDTQAQKLHTDLELYKIFKHQNK